MLAFIRVKVIVIGEYKLRAGFQVCYLNWINHRTIVSHHKDGNFHITGDVSEFRVRPAHGFQPDHVAELFGYLSNRDQPAFRSTPTLWHQLPRPVPHNGCPVHHKVIQVYSTWPFQPRLFHEIWNVSVVADKPYNHQVRTIMSGYTQKALDFHGGIVPWHSKVQGL